MGETKMRALQEEEDTLAGEGRTGGEKPQPEGFDSQRQSPHRKPSLRRPGSTVLLQMETVEPRH